ncbi:unnamed protein product, partial [Staurois parvus]
CNSEGWCDLSVWNPGNTEDGDISLWGFLVLGGSIISLCPSEKLLHHSILLILLFILFFKHQYYHPRGFHSERYTVM